MRLFIALLFILCACGDTYETTNITVISPDASAVDVAIDTQTGATKHDSSADTAVDTWTEPDTAKPDAYTEPDTWEAPDTKTGLTWTRIAFAHCNSIGTCSGHSFKNAQAHCKAIGKRLPTLLETDPISGDNLNKCAFPCNWETWTDYSLKTGYEYVRFSSGEIIDMPETSPRTFLCVN